MMKKNDLMVPILQLNDEDEEAEGHWTVLEEFNEN